MAEVVPRGDASLEQMQMIGCMEKVPDLEDLWPQQDFCGVTSFDDQTSRDLELS